MKKKKSEKEHENLTWLGPNIGRELERVL